MCGGGGGGSHPIIPSVSPDHLACLHMDCDV